MKHPCADCGAPCDRHHDRCRSCGNLRAWSLKRGRADREGVLFHSGRSHCPNGHRYTPETTGVWPRDGIPSRYCIPCRLAKYARKNAGRRKVAA